MAQDEFYKTLHLQLQSLLENEHDPIANMANTSALLFMSLSDINWAGFYLYKEEELILGPFQGKPACIHIAIGKGVCGTCAQSQIIQRIANVHEFPGHIACDSSSSSELVIPILKQGRFFVVLDIDSTSYERFNEEDEQELYHIVKILESSFLD